jgi:hypothetical protein
MIQPRWGLEIILRRVPRVGDRLANPGLNDAIPLGLSEIGAELWVMTRHLCRFSVRQKMTAEFIWSF